jgi:hypothetical protein
MVAYNGRRVKMSVGKKWFSEIGICVILKLRIVCNS